MRMSVVKHRRILDPGLLIELEYGNAQQCIEQRGLERYPVILLNVRISDKFAAFGDPQRSRFRQIWNIK